MHISTFIYKDVCITERNNKVYIYINIVTKSYENNIYLEISLKSVQIF